MRRTCRRATLPFIVTAAAAVLEYATIMAPLTAATTASFGNRRLLILSPRRAAATVTHHSVLLLSAETHKTLASGGPFQSELEVKKSRFIGYAKRVGSWKEAKEYISEIRTVEHPKARHWCYGFRCGTNPVTERCSDDGEPTGTAGIPILGAIKGEDLSDTACVVVRYFGGVKLGAGGLIRAYGAAARQVLREAPVEELVPKSTMRVTVDAAHIGPLYDSSSRFAADASGEEYGDDGSLTVSLTCETSTVGQLQALINDSTKGNAAFMLPGEGDEQQ